jgi:hypothetical protein
MICIVMVVAAIEACFTDQLRVHYMYVTFYFNHKLPQKSLKGGPGQSSGVPKYSIWTGTLIMKISKGVIHMFTVRLNMYT